MFRVRKKNMVSITLKKLILRNGELWDIQKPAVYSTEKKYSSQPDLMMSISGHHFNCMMKPVIHRVRLSQLN